MKKIILLLVITILILSMSGFTTVPEYDEDTNYMSIMQQAVKDMDSDTGEAAEISRNAKIDALGLDVTKVKFDDLFWLSKIIQAEAGSSWISVEWKMDVGEVVLNRVISPEFAGTTIKEILDQPGQYYGANSRYLKNITPCDDALTAAYRLLNGERTMHPSVIFQANFRQGSGVYRKYECSLLGSTYFCVSSYPEYYE